MAGIDEHVIKDENDGAAAPDDDAGQKGEEKQFDLTDEVAKAYESMDEGGEDAAPATDPHDPQGKEQGTEEPGEDAGSDDDAAADKAGEEKETDDGADKGKTAKADDNEPDALRDEDLELTDEERRSLKRESQERFQRLSKGYRESKQELDNLRSEHGQVREQHQAMVDLINETNASPEYLADLFDMTSDLNSGDPQRGRQGVQRAYNMVKGWAKHYGVKLPEHSILEDHPDLQQKVENGEITQEIAEQHASMRAWQRSQQQTQQRQRATQEQLEGHRQAAMQAGQELNQIEAGWKKNDPDYQSKAPMLNEYAQQLAQQVLNGELHPSQAVTLIKERYDTITRTMKTVAQNMRQNRHRDDPNPARPGPPRGGNEKPSFDSVEDAVFGTYRSM